MLSTWRAQRELKQDFKVVAALPAQVGLFDPTARHRSSGRNVIASWTGTTPMAQEAITKGDTRWAAVGDTSAPLPRACCGRRLDWKRWLPCFCHSAG